MSFGIVIGTYDGTIFIKTLGISKGISRSHKASARISLLQHLQKYITQAYFPQLIITSITLIQHLQQVGIYWGEI
jgi:hypothetical protein